MRITGPITGTRWASVVGTLAFGRSWPCRNGASSRLAAKDASNPSMSVTDRVCGCEVACARVQLLSYVRGWCDEMRMHGGIGDVLESSTRKETSSDAFVS